MITKNGEPIVKLVPYRDRPTTMFGVDIGSLRILGDIVEPLDVKWEAMQIGPEEQDRE